MTQHDKSFYSLTIFLVLALLAMDWQLVQVKIQRDEAESRLVVAWAEIGNKIHLIEPQTDEIVIEKTIPR